MAPPTAAVQLAVAPDGSRTVLQPLLDLRRGTGRTVQLSTLEDVFDEFNGGVRSELAIRRYLAVQLPAYAVLVGVPAVAGGRVGTRVPRSLSGRSLTLAFAALLAAIGGWLILG